MCKLKQSRTSAYKRLRKDLCRPYTPFLLALILGVFNEIIEKTVETHKPAE
jgi:hypothetical protein